MKLEPHRDTPARRPSPSLSFFVFDGLGFSADALLRLLCLRPCGLQVGLTGFEKAFSSHEARPPNHIETPSPIADAKIGKVFHDEEVARLLDGMRAFGARI